MNSINAVAFIFPGQGAQTVGMGKSFYDGSPAAKAIFDQAQNVLGNDLLDVVFNGPQEKLTLTSYSQPAIVTFSIAALAAFKESPKFKNVNPKFTAGLSLGEYSALIASEAFSFEDGIRLVERRGAFMEEACNINKGTMAAVIGFDKIKLKEICSQAGVEVANFNSPVQIVISGEVEKVEKACEMIKSAGAKSVILLDVAGAFHSSLMGPAVDKFKGELNKIIINPLIIPVVSNVKAVAETDPVAIADNLPKQITSSVLWEDSVRFMAAEGITDFIEIGPGTVLKGLIRKIDRELRVHNIEKPGDIESLPF
ncbi:MAG: ACP S-malonyltransferase [Candidatus Omnitrophica bacterium]|nr:ACP S-malonyltransferase [Candidatus Omnitrophota bacterium]